MSIILKMVRILEMFISAVAAIICIIYLQAYGAWTTLLIYLLLTILFCIYHSSRAWKIWIALVISTTYLLSFVGAILRVRLNEEGRIQVVSVLYPIYPKVYIDGLAIDTIELATGYTYAGWYNVERSKYYAIKDTNDLTKICRPDDGRDGRVVQGHQLIIEDYDGPHGTINILNYTDKNGNHVRQDLYGQNVDDELYAVHVRDDADFIYIP